MFLTPSKINVHPSISKILSQYSLLLITLEHDKFGYLSRAAGISRECAGIAVLRTPIILINEGLIKRDKYTAEMINYVILHEVSHILMCTNKEDEAHEGAVDLAKKLNVDIDFSFADLNPQEKRSKHV